MGSEPYSRVYNTLSRYTKFFGKTILEIGGNQNLASAQPFVEGGAAKVIVSGLSHIGTERTAANGKIEVVKANGHNAKQTFGSSKFDIVYGMSVIEHISMPSSFLEQVFYVLKPGGFCFFDGGPIWSSSLGHHIWLSTKKNNYFFQTPPDNPAAVSVNPIPVWGHLLMNSTELSAFMGDNGVLAEDIPAICHSVYNSPGINRLTYSEIAMSYSNSPFTVLEARKSGFIEVPHNILAPLRDLYGDSNDFGVSHIYYVLYKHP